MKHFLRTFWVASLIPYVAIATFPDSLKRDALCVRSSPAAPPQTCEAFQAFTEHPFFHITHPLFPQATLQDLAQTCAKREETINYDYEAQCTEIGISYDEARAAFCALPKPKEDQKVIERWKKHLTAEEAHELQTRANQQALIIPVSESYQQMEKSLPADVLVAYVGLAKEACHFFTGLRFDSVQEAKQAKWYWRIADTFRAASGEGLKRLIDHRFFQDFFTGLELQDVVATWVTAEKEINKASAARTQQIGGTYQEAFEAFERSPQDPKIVAQWNVHKAEHARYAKDIEDNDQVLARYAQARYKELPRGSLDIHDKKNSPEGALRLFREIADGTGFGLDHHAALANGYWHIAENFHIAARAAAPPQLAPIPE